MKTMIIFVIFAAIFLLAGLLERCDLYESTKKISGEKLGRMNGVWYDKIIVDGHHYLSASLARAVSITHMESCPCKTKK